MEKTKLEQDVEWIMERCPKLNSLAILEPSAQAIAIMFAIAGEMPLNDKEIAKLSLVGLIATHMRKLDEQKFHELSPQAYLQVANYYLDPEDTGEGYKTLITKLQNLKK
jgi:hypothetical protein